MLVGREAAVSIASLGDKVTVGQPVEVACRVEEEVLCMMVMVIMMIIMTMMIMVMMVMGRRRR